MVSNKFTIPLSGTVSERVLEDEERPWRIVVRLARESVRRMELARFYLQPRRDPHGPTLALFVASLPPGLSERNYENILVEFLGAGMHRSQHSVRVILPGQEKNQSFNK